MYREFPCLPFAAPSRRGSFLLSFLDLARVGKSLKSGDEFTGMTNVDAKATADLSHRAPAIVEACGDRTVVNFHNNPRLTILLIWRNR